MWSSKAFLLAALGLAVGAAAPARADMPAVVDTTVSTLLTGHADPRDGQLHTILPVYESLAVLATLQPQYTDGLRVVFSGWGGMVLDIPSQQTWTGDIDAGYLEGNFLKQRVQVRVGRQLVTGGAARISQMDGLSARVRLLGGLGLSGYGGVPVTPRFGVSRGDALYGGRLFYRHSYDTEIGVSFNQVLGQGRIARQDLGVDARYVPTRQVTMTAYALLSIAELRLAEADAAILWQPHAVVQVSADYRRTAPDLFLPLNSVLSVFSQETRDEAGVTLYLRPAHRLRLYGDYRTIFNEEGTGHRGGGKLSVALGELQNTTLNGEVRVLKLPSNGYVQGRLYSLHHITPSLLGTLGADIYFLDRALPGYGDQTVSFTGSGTLAWELGRGFRLVGSGMADVTPFVQQRLEFILRLAYNATQRFHEVQR